MSNDLLNYQAAPDLLADRVILITGAGAGIGRAVAIAAANHGATVVLLGRTVTKLEETYDVIVSAEAPVPVIVPLDLKTAGIDQYRDLAAQLEDQFGRLDGLLHNAGILGERAPLRDYEPPVWHDVMQINVNATFLLTQACLPLLLAADDAAVLFTSSGVGRVGRAYWGAYSVSKFATEGLMEVLADEVEQTSALRVNCLNPGATRTAMRQAAYPAEDPQTLPTPESLAPAYLFLLGPDSAGVRGQSIDAQG